MVIRSITARPVTQSQFNGAVAPIDQVTDGPYVATHLSRSPSTRMMSASVTWSSRAALSAMVVSTASTSVGELEIARSTSAVADCWSNASARCLRSSASKRSRASICPFNLVMEVRSGLTRVLAFALGERTRVGARSFAPLRAKIPSSAWSSGPGWRTGSLSESLARPGRRCVMPSTIAAETFRHWRDRTREPPAEARGAVRCAGLPMSLRNCPPAFAAVPVGRQ